MKSTLHCYSHAFNSLFFTMEQLWRICEKLSLHFKSTNKQTVYAIESRCLICKASFFNSIDMMKCNWLQQHVQCTLYTFQPAKFNVNTFCLELYTKVFNKHNKKEKKSLPSYTSCRIHRTTCLFRCYCFIVMIQFVVWMKYLHDMLWAALCVCVSTKN